MRRPRCRGCKRTGRGRCASPRGGSSSWSSEPACKCGGRLGTGSQPPLPPRLGRSYFSTSTHTLARLQGITLDGNVSPEEDLAANLLFGFLQGWLEGLPCFYTFRPLHFSFLYGLIEERGKHTKQQVDPRRQSHVLIQYFLCETGLLIHPYYTVKGLTAPACLA